MFSGTSPDIKLNTEKYITVMVFVRRMLLVEDPAQLSRARPVVVAPVEHRCVPPARVLHYNPEKHVVSYNYMAIIKD